MKLAFLLILSWIIGYFHAADSQILPKPCLYRNIPQRNDPKVALLDISIVHEECDDSPSRSCKAIITTPAKYFSESNIATLSRWYSSRYPDKSESLSAYVYAQEDFLENKQYIESLHFDLSQKATYQLPNKYLITAYFQRNQMDHITDGEVTEYYSYRPQSQPDGKLVIVRGSLRTRRRELMDSLEMQRHIFKVRGVSYRLPGVTPEGVYHSFEVYSTELGWWQGIISLRLDEPVSLKHNQISFVSNDICFVFVGWKYAVTTDGGKTWTKWDAEDQFINTSCCHSNLIKNVQILPNGEGVMYLNSEQSTYSALYTKDYGKHWEINRN